MAGSEFLSLQVDCKSTRFSPRTTKLTFPAVCSELEEPFTSYLICHGAKFVFPRFGIDSPDVPSCLFVFHWCCDVGHEASQAEPEPRAEVTAILSPFNRSKSQRDSSKSQCGWRRRHPRSRRHLWGRKQLLPLWLSTIIKLIKAVQSRWYLSCASWMSRRCDKCQWDECVVWRETLSMLDTFLLRLFPRSAAKTPADGECWRGGFLPRVHTVAPSRRSSKRPRTECLRDTILTQCSSRQADLKHVQMDYSSGLQWYHQFGVWGDFSGTIYCLGASEEAARCRDKMESKSLFQKKKRV